MDFDKLARDMLQESDIYSTNPAEFATSLEDSYSRGDATVLKHDAKVIAYVRNLPLLPHWVRTANAIYEFGALYVAPEFRGDGITRPNLLRTHLGRTDTGENLIMGTAKHIRVLLSLGDSIGSTFQYGHHSDLPMIEALTCVCEGNFGQGVQHTPNCSKRTELPIGEYTQARQARIHTNNLGCVVFYSRLELARRINRQLLDEFQSQENFIQLLNQDNYYGNFGKVAE